MGLAFNSTRLAYHKSLEITQTTAVGAMYPPTNKLHQLDIMVNIFILIVAAVSTGIGDAGHEGAGGSRAAGGAAGGAADTARGGCAAG